MTHKPVRPMAKHLNSGGFVYHFQVVCKIYGNVVVLKNDSQPSGRVDGANSE